MKEINKGREMDRRKDKVRARASKEQDYPLELKHV